jgi:hypothetical protein
MLLFLVAVYWAAVSLYRLAGYDPSKSEFGPSFYSREHGTLCARKVQGFFGKGKVFCEDPNDPGHYTQPY